MNDINDLDVLGEPAGEALQSPIVVAPADRRPIPVYLASLTSPNSRRTMTWAIRQVAAAIAGPAVDPDAFPWWELRKQHTDAVRARIAGEASSIKSANICLCALRGVLKACRTLRLMSLEDYEDAVSFKAAKGEDPQRGRAIDRRELDALYKGCSDGSIIGKRDAALFAILDGAGLRRAEAAALVVGDYDRASGVLTVRRGKGRKARTVPVAPVFRQWIVAWLDVSGASQDASERALLCPVYRGGDIRRRHLTGGVVAVIAARRRAAAGLEPITPHDFRRTFASEMLDSGVDLATVATMMGHANTDTTAKYDRRGERAKVDASIKRAEWIGKHSKEGPW